MFLFHAHLVVPATLTQDLYHEMKGRECMILSCQRCISIFLPTKHRSEASDRIQEFADFKMASMVRIPLTFSKFLNSFFFSFCLSSERIVDEK